MAGHPYSIIHWFSNEARVNVKNVSFEGDRSNVQIISTSWTRSGVEVCLFSITYKHKTNHQGGSNLFGTPVPRHKVHIRCVVLLWALLTLQTSLALDWNGSCFFLLVFVNHKDCCYQKLSF